MILTVMMLTSMVSAFGVSSPYWGGNNPNPLNLARGESVTIDLNLQNMVGDEDVEIVGILKEGSEIATLKGDIFLIKAKTSDTMVPLKISIPRNMPAGTTKKIMVEFKTINSDEEGMVSMGTGMGVSFDVIVTEEIASYNLRMVIGLILGIIILAGIIWWALNGKKPSKRSRKKKKK